MTLEEKAEKYARKTKKVDWEGFDVDKEARKEGYIAGATENGIIWHDLRKNPNDLPDDEREVLQQGGLWVMYINGHWRFVNGEKWEDDAHVYAWIDIPVFLEVEDA